MEAAIAGGLGRVLYLNPRRMKIDFGNLYLAEVHSKEALGPHLGDPYCWREDKLFIWFITKSHGRVADHRICLS